MTVNARTAAYCAAARSILMGVIALLAAHVSAQEVSRKPLSPSIDSEGVVHIPPVDVPLSPYMSDAAKRQFLQNWGLNARWPSDPAQQRVEFERLVVVPARSGYRTSVELAVISAVRTLSFTPLNGVSAQNAHRILINLHGGSFNTQIPDEFQSIESIPIAVAGRIKVISIDYREAPDHRFPAASEDVEAVYRALLKRYSPEDIGLYGCSAGGILAAESLAWFQKHRLPMPGAVALLSAGADVLKQGDSVYFALPLAGESAPSPHPLRDVSDPRGYFFNQDIRDSLISPGLHSDVLAKFPPALLITGTRDFLMSSAIRTHTELTRLSRVADLHVYEGMGHAFIYDTTLPESKEAYDVVVKFFAAHLGHR